MQRLVIAATLLAMAATAFATETENQHLRVLPAPAAVKVDGDPTDWDLAGGIFVCGDVESQRTKSAVWLHAMYDAKHLYVLARWVDPTPMNNPGTVKGSAGFNGDSLQLRMIVGERLSHWTCWRDVDGASSATAEYGRKFNEGKADLLSGGGAMAFARNPDGDGYVQEIAFPWALLATDPPRPGEAFQLTVEPNFTISGVGRLSIKDLFKAGVTPNRVFTYMDSAVWGTARLEPRGGGEPQPVRLSDTREFPVRLQDGVPVVDWTGLIKSDRPAGFKPIKSATPADGYVSLNLFAPDGTVARQLLTNHFFTKGDHEVMWDGLSTPSHKRPGTPVPAGTYTWQAIGHTGVGLKLRGWAAGAGTSPWDGFGGDHGNPIAAAADDQRVYLGWAGGEGSKPLIALDTDGKVVWRNIRGGIADARLLAADGKHVFVFNSQSRFAPVSIYKLDAQTGKYADFTALKSTDLSLKQLVGETNQKIAAPDGLAAGGGKVFVSFEPLNLIHAIDAETGERARSYDAPDAGALCYAGKNRLLFISGGKTVVALDLTTGLPTPIAELVTERRSYAKSITIDKAGNIYVGQSEGDHQIVVFAPDGTQQRTIGRPGGRVPQGPWNPDGLLNLAGLAIDAKNRLWAMENSASPRRVSVWDAADGKLLSEHFGPSSYGAQGGAINPLDPDLMVGQGVEWRLDARTGRGKPTQHITQKPMANSRFGFSPDKRLYLATTNDAIHGINPVWIYERTADGYQLRTVIRHEERGTEKKRHAVVWADENGDQTEQPEETRAWPLPDDYAGWITGWYMPMTPDLTFYGSQYRLKVSGWSPCGAPYYTFNQLEKLSAPARLHAKRGMGEQKGHGSADGRFMLYNGDYNTEHSTFECYDLSTGKWAWSYPNNYTGVHGSHKAPGGAAGLIRGAYDITGAAKLPVVGNVWVIPANKGEWHLLTETGFYLTHLFQTDPMKWAWPEQAVPGADLTNVPPGAGEEAFGGSITQGVDGKLYVQAGHTSFWNAQVTGLESLRELGTGSVTIAEADLATAAKFRADLLQAAVGTKRLTVRRATPKFTGDVTGDFKGADVLQYKKTDTAAVRTAVAWDDKCLYAAWEVRDDTPWVNGADAAEFLYARGDSVDLQLGTDLTGHKEAAPGDLRLSIGPFNGRPTAVLYRKVSAKKNPRTFSSGTAAAYTMDSVSVLTDVNINVNSDPAKKQYTVQAAIPWTALEVTPADGLKLRGDFGVTHSDKSGGDTALRTHWSNQDTGLVSDEVYELHMAPANWGELILAGESAR